MNIFDNNIHDKHNYFIINEHHWLCKHICLYNLCLCIMIFTCLLSWLNVGIWHQYMVKHMLLNNDLFLLIR